MMGTVADQIIAALDRYRDAKWWAWDYRPSRPLHRSEIRRAVIWGHDHNALAAGRDGLWCLQWVKWPDRWEAAELETMLHRLPPGRFRIAPWARDCSCDEGKCTTGSAASCGPDGIQWTEADWVTVDRSAVNTKH